MTSQSLNDSRSIAIAAKETSEKEARKRNRESWRKAAGLGLRDYALGALGPICAAIGAPFTQTFFKKVIEAPPRTPAHAPDLVLFIVFLGLMIFGIAFGAYRQFVNSKKVEFANKRKTQDLTRFTDELGSILDVLVEYSRTNGNKEDRERLLQNILREGRRLYAHDGVRLCLYLLEENFIAPEDEVPEEKELKGSTSHPAAGAHDPGGATATAATGSGSDDGSSPPEPALLPHILILEEHTGRRDIPRSKFVDGDHSRALVEIAQANYAVAISDPDDPPLHCDSDGNWKLLPIDRSEHSGWSSCMAIPVTGEDENKGLLLVDLREPHNFTEDDRSIGWTIARLISHGLDATIDKAQDVVPESTQLVFELAALANQPNLESHGREGVRVEDEEDC